MRIIEDRKLDFADVLIVPKRSALTSRAEVDLIRTFKMPHSGREWSCVPIVASNMYATGSMEMAKAFNIEKMCVALHKYYSFQDLCDFFYVKEVDLPNLTTSKYNFITIGLSKDELSRVSAIYSSIHPNVCIDAANGYTKAFSDFVKLVRETLPYSIIMAGNVVTPEMTEQLILDGADIVKIGIGSGSVCRTRNLTGIGMPQFSSIVECSDAAHGLKGHICSDGGIREVADFCKAFCAGADFVMSGGFFAGTDECNGEWVPEYGFLKKKHLKFFGMSSYEAMEQFGGKEKEYRASEGTCQYIPHKGEAKNIIKEILGGLRSCGTYIGATRLKDFSKCATFIKT